METEGTTVAPTTNEIPVPVGLAPFDLRVKADRLKEWAGYIGVCVSEAKLTVSRDGVKCTTVDPSHVAMLVTTIHRSAFEELSAPVEPVAIGVDFPKLLSAIRTGKKGDPVSIRFDGVNLTVEVAGLTRTMRTVDPAGIMDPKVPTVVGSGEIRVDRDALFETIRAAGEITDHVVLEMGWGDAPTLPQLKISAEGETDKVRRVLTPTAGDAWSGAPFKSMYPLDFLESMLKAAKSAETVLLRSGNEYPLRIDFVTGWSEGMYLLAPRVEEDYSPSYGPEPDPASAETGDSDSEISDVAAEDETMVTDDSPEARPIPAPDDDGDNDSPPAHRRSRRTTPFGPARSPPELPQLARSETTMPTTGGRNPVERTFLDAVRIGSAVRGECYLQPSATPSPGPVETPPASPPNSF